MHKTIPVAARSKAWVYGSSLAEIMVSKPAGSIDVSFECREIEVSATGQSVVQRSPTEGGVSKCEL